MKTIKIRILTAACAALIMNSAIAEAPLPCGWYIEGNFGSSRISNISGVDISSSGFGWNANIGYKFMPFFALEAGYTNYAEANLRINGVQVATDKPYTIDVAGKAILPISDSSFEVFGKLGAARVTSKYSIEQPTLTTLPSGTTNKTVLYIGAGGDFVWSPALPINVQWQRAVSTSNSSSSTTGTLDLYSVGITYIFG